MHSFKGNF